MTTELHNLVGIVAHKLPREVLTHDRGVAHSRQHSRTCGRVCNSPAALVSYYINECVQLCGRVQALRQRVCAILWSCVYDYAVAHVQLPQLCMILYQQEFFTTSATLASEICYFICCPGQLHIQSCATLPAAMANHVPVVVNFVAAPTN